MIAGAAVVPVVLDPLKPPADKRVVVPLVALLTVQGPDKDADWPTYKSP